MKNIRLAKDDNTIYLSVTCETEDEMKRITEIINKVLCPSTEAEAEKLEGAKALKPVAPAPISGAEEIPVAPVQNNQEEEKKEEERKEEKNPDICPICGNKLTSGTGGKRCTKCLYQDKVYGTEITEEMITMLKEKGKTEDIKFNSSGREGHLEIINGKFKFVNKKKAA